LVVEDNSSQQPAIAYRFENLRSQDHTVNTSPITEAPVSTLLADTDPTQGITLTVSGVPCLVELWPADDGHPLVSISTINSDHIVTTRCLVDVPLSHVITDALEHGEPHSWPGFYDETPLLLTLTLPVVEPVATPECDRMIAARSDTQPVGEFIEWAREQGLVLCRFGRHDRYWPDNRSLEQLLAAWQHIDLAEVERERRAVLDCMRATTKEALAL
jgi:hypothetical protein